MLTITKLCLQYSRTEIASLQLITKFRKNFDSRVKPLQNLHHRKYGKKVGFTLKSHQCGELRTVNVGDSVTLRGYLQYQRMGKFAVLRDASGLTQMVVKDEDVDMRKMLEDTPYESYIEMKGTVRLRPENQQNKDMPTGEIEVEADSYKILSQVQQELPFLIRDFNKPKEHLRLKYRYLDLRHKELQDNLRLRSKVGKKMRDYLQDKEEFVEITTPTLSFNTPGGAQEFVVPTRLPSKFYSLVQSPQTYKQLAMIGGFDRYFQFAVCYRDEGGKSDRQPEFMQVDLEMVDVTMGELQNLLENLITYSWPSHLPSIESPFPVITYNEAMTVYGVDKPDTRFDWKIQDVTKVLQDSGVNILQTILSSPGNTAHAFIIPGGKNHINKKIVSSWEKLAKEEHDINGPTVLHIIEDNSLQGMLAKRMSTTSQSVLTEKLNARAGDTIVMSAGVSHSALGLLGKLRLLSANILEEAGVPVREPGKYEFLWIVDFPLFELDEMGKLSSVHHPFTRPKNEDVDYIYTEPLKARSQHFDLVLNGSEVGGGSMRIYEPEMQRYVLEDVLGIESASLGFFNQALGSGTPPHGGFAIGFDRLIAEMCRAKSIRDVIAFPKSMEGKCLMSGAPSDITQEEQRLYHIESTKQDFSVVMKDS